MIIPVFQRTQFVDKDGYLTSAMQLYNDELNSVLRNGLSDNGWTLPTVTSAELTSIQGQMPNGTIWYLHDTGSSTYEVIVKINGALRKVSTTAYP